MHRPVTGDENMLSELRLSDLKGFETKPTWRQLILTSEF